MLAIYIITTPLLLLLYYKHEHTLQNTILQITNLRNLQTTLTNYNFTNTTHKATPA